MPGRFISTDLLFDMSKSLGYRTNKAKIGGDVYAPEYFEKVEQEQNALRKAAVSVFQGEHALKMTMIKEPEEPQLRIPGSGAKTP
jgi:hypothetical protein